MLRVSALGLAAWRRLAAVRRIPSLLMASSQSAVNLATVFAADFASALNKSWTWAKAACRQTLGLPWPHPLFPPPPPPVILGTGCPPGRYFMPKSLSDAEEPDGFLVSGRRDGDGMATVHIYSLLLRTAIPLFSVFNPERKILGMAPHGPWLCIIAFSDATPFSFHAIRVADGMVSLGRAGLLESLEEFKMKWFLGARYVAAEGRVLVAFLEASESALLCLCFTGPAWDLAWVSRCSAPELLAPLAVMWSRGDPACGRVFCSLEGEALGRCLAEYRLDWATGAWQRTEVGGSEAKAELSRHWDRKSAGTVVDQGTTSRILRVDAAGNVCFAKAARAPPSLATAAWASLRPSLEPALAQRPTPCAVYEVLLALRVPRPLLHNIRHHNELRHSPQLPIVINLTEYT